MKKLYATLLLLLYFPAAFATSIVIIVTPEYILMGTDSKRQVFQGGMRMAAEQTVCKIQRSGNYYFAMAGLTASSTTAYAASNIVGKHLQNKEPYAQTIASIKEDLKKALEKELNAMRIQQSPAFRQLIASSEPLLEIVVLSLQNNMPQMEIIGFQHGRNQSVQVGSYTARCPGDCPPRQQQIYFMGSYQTMEQQLNRQQQVKDPIALIENLITEQSKATPGSVGAPVRMVKFAAAGVEWIR